MTLCCLGELVEGFLAFATAIGAANVPTGDQIVEQVADAAGGNVCQAGGELWESHWIALQDVEQFACGGREGAGRGGRGGEGEVEYGLAIRREAKVGLGSKRYGGDVAGFKGADVDDVFVRRGFNSEHMIHAGSDKVGAAKDAAFVGMVDDKDGGIGLSGEAGEIGDDRLYGEYVVLVHARHDVDEGIYDDEARIEGTGASRDSIHFGAVGEVVARGRQKI